MVLLLTLALAGNYDRFVEQVSGEARAWTEPTLAGSNEPAREAWQKLWLAAGPSSDFDSDGPKRVGDSGVRRALRRAWDPTLPKPRKLSEACVALGWPELSDDPVIARVDTPTCLLLKQHRLHLGQWQAAAKGGSPRNPAPAFDAFMEDGEGLRSTYPLRSMARSAMLLAWAEGDPIDAAAASARLGWDLTLGGDVSVTLSGLSTLQDAHDVLKGYALESDRGELERIAVVSEELAATPTDLQQLARLAYLSSVTLMLRAVDPESALIAHGTVASRRAPLGSLGDLDAMKLPIKQFLKGAHREAWTKAFEMATIRDFDKRQEALRGLATELEESGGPVAALVGAAASQEIEGLARWDTRITVRRQEACLLGAAVKLALGREAGACPLGLEQREDGLYATRTAEQLELKGRWLEALYMPVPAPPD